MRVDISGGCICGGVGYHAKDAATKLTACHCRECRKTTGHHFATTNALKENLTLDNDETLAWYASSKRAERGFCNRCGASLFFRPKEGRYIGILAGSVDNSDAMFIFQHIYVGEKGGYYDLPDDIPQHATFPQKPAS